MEINFPAMEAKGFSNAIRHVSKDGQDVIARMLIYDKDERWTAAQVMKHPYFKELYEFDHQK
jgi:serine/threonine protein kinase